MENVKQIMQSISGDLTGQFQSLSRPFKGNHGNATDNLFFSL